MTQSTTIPTTPIVPTAANRFGLDYAKEASSFGPPPVPMIDVHSHISGESAARIFKRAADLYGVNLIYSMTALEHVDAMRAVFGESMRFIAVPNFRAEDKKYAMGRGYVDDIVKFHEKGARIVKFWVAPRSVDYAEEFGAPGMLRLDAPLRIEAMEQASDLGMYFMTHVADPDTWFTGKYSDASRYGTKLDQYTPLEALLDRFTQPWIAAHMGGWPEDLSFLTQLLERHDNLYLDTSATKWIVREVSRHRRDEVVGFMRQFKGRLLFGSDIVAMDDHLKPADESEHEIMRKASNAEEAFDLYASRYWALRTLWETDYDGESPIADPDLMMNDPEQYDAMSAPALRGQSLPDDLLRSLYHDAAEALLEPLFD